jgi:hypothetical protein
MCYETLIGPRTAAVSLYGMHPAADCNREIERTAVFGVFPKCSEASASSGVLHGPLPSIFCRDNTNVLTDNLSCPAWSTIQSGGTVELRVSSHMLSFWGCACPTDHFWGYALDNETAALAAVASEALVTEDESLSLGEIEQALAARTCVPCPANVDCSPLAVADAPHSIVGSRFPYFSTEVPAVRISLICRAAIRSDVHLVVVELGDTRATHPSSLPRLRHAA